MLEVYEKVFNAGQHELASHYFEPDYREHNIGIEDGIAASAAHQQALGGYPNTVLRHVRDGDLHFVHAIYQFWPTIVAVVDVYRLNEDGKVAEHWDAVEALIDNDLTCTASLPDDNDRPRFEPAELRTTVRRLFDRGFHSRDQSFVAAMLSGAFVDHQLSSAAPLPALSERSGGSVALDELRLIAAQDDLCFAYSNFRSADGSIFHACDIFRFDHDLRIAEHWAVSDYLPTESLTGIRARGRDEYIV